MTQKELETLYQYIWRNHDRLHGEVRDIQQRVRYTDCDVVDGFELSLAIERYNMFCVVVHDIRQLLNLSKCELEDVPDIKKRSLD